MHQYSQWKTHVDSIFLPEGFLCKNLLLANLVVQNMNGYHQMINVELPPRLIVSDNPHLLDGLLIFGNHTEKIL